MSQPEFISRLPALIEAAASVIEAGDLQQLLRRLVSEARLATGALYVALGVIGDHGVLVEFIHEGMSPETVARIGMPPKGLGVLGTVVREKKTIRLDSIEDHPDSYGFPPNHPSMRSFLGVPVMAGGRAFGNLYLSDKKGGFTDSDVVTIEALSRIAGSALTTARLHERLRSLAVVEDRERIARDLHDSVIQDLFAVGLGLQGVSARVTDETAAATLENSVDRLDTAVETLRSYVFQLRAGPQHPLQLEDRLQELVSRMGAAYPSDVRLDLAVTERGEGPFDDEIFKLVTEALSNALRHSGAAHVDVLVESGADGWRLRVQDDGRGFDTDLASPGMGLSNLNSRTARLGGTTSITSSPGVGTLVEIEIPVS
ncbi:MAG: GAF domain-containing sensor histidine kinase [Acidimicrobiia bacterium]